MKAAVASTLSNRTKILSIKA